MRKAFIEELSPNVMQGHLVRYLELNFRKVVEYYDSRVFHNHLAAMIASKRLVYDIQWSDLIESPAVLNVTEEGTLVQFELRLSSKVFLALKGTRKQPHVVFGVPCKTQIECILIYVESFVSSMMYEMCENQKETESDFSKVFFGHTNSDAAFQPAEQDMRLRLQDLLKSGVKPIARVKDLEGEYEIVGARNTATFTFKEDAKLGENRYHAYSSITHLNGVEL
jgi:hypothetical protein